MPKTSHRLRIDTYLVENSFVMYRILLIAIFSSLILSACSGAADKGASAPEASANAKRYTLKGKVVSVDRAAKKAKIAHEKIDGFMDAMEMEFPIHADWVWDELKPGAEIRAELVVDSTAKEPYWLENIGIIAAADPNAPAPTPNDKFDQVGQKVKDFKLTGEDGKAISPSTFAGKAWAVTFIYRECPLPDYCIKMSQRFSDIANKINADAESRKKYALLSISFDPARDTPEKLKQYGLGYLGQGAKDLGIWHLAVGSDAEVKKVADSFGVRYETDENDKTQINHSLRTAVIAPDGTVTKIFPGNEWTTQQLIDELQSASAR